MSAEISRTNKALAPKTLPPELGEMLTDMIQLVNNIKSCVHNTRRYQFLCQDFNSVHETLLFHTEIRWLSRVNVLKRVSELQGEKREFFQSWQKHGVQEVPSKLDDKDLDHLIPSALWISFLA